jgi:AcrR family transcriptional regulator
MKKGQLTREMILSRAAALFNTEGYSKASLSDIMAATGLEKGGIYNHFGSKEQLMLEAFDYAVRQGGARIKQQVDAQPTAESKLCAVIDAFATLSQESPVPGGCPVMNTAIESDDSMPELKERAKAAMQRLLKFIEQIIKDGIAEGEFKEDIDAAESATLLIASLEGGLMLSKLFSSASKTRPLQTFWKNEIRSWTRRRKQ